ncbi:uroporphyrinogen decarboxylase family protein [candidate division CSSED10-310 bacterium]|uniref:Uroporphyrinogen decarboxylase family protein n=1 Tax=candidate division CSSED10-310 bacterium TaxID=2855610 RepID=A0ABV6YRB1_UNCC1
MTAEQMTATERVMTALQHQEPDRVPFFLLVTTHGAQELNLSIKEYFSRPQNVARGQLQLRNRFGHDCLYNFFYAAVEVEAWGGDILYYDDGPPNAGMPIIKEFEDIEHLEPPLVERSPCLQNVLQATSIMKETVRDEVPIIGVVMSPFSLPVMQMGFEKYLMLIFEQPDLFQRLMNINEEFCVSWANAQLEAGATAICYFDPVSSPTITPREKYLKTGFIIAQKTIARIKGPTATHLASGRCQAIITDLAQTGTAMVGVGVDEDLAVLKKESQGKLSLLGNLNGIAMRNWDAGQVDALVQQAIARAGAGGGYILSDNHGEIPYQVPFDVLLMISDAVRRWGKYPLPESL